MGKRLEAKRAQAAERILAALQAGPRVFNNFVLATGEVGMEGASVTAYYISVEHEDGEQTPVAMILDPHLLQHLDALVSAANAAAGKKNEEGEAEDEEVEVVEGEEEDDEVEAAPRRGKRFKL